MTVEAIAALQREVANVKAVAATLSPEEWAAASDCAGWRVQDVVCHMASVYEQIASPGSMPSSDDGDAEKTAELAVEARRDWSPEQVMAAYEEWSDKGVAALAGLQEPPMADAVVPLGNLGSHPLHLLANAIVFDHYCHLRHDILAPGGTVERAPLPPDEGALAAAVEWMLAGLPQMCADGLEALDRPLNLVFTGPAAGSWVLRPGDGLSVVERGEAADAAASVTTTAHDFVQWGTKRRDWRVSGVTVTGDEAYAASVLDAVNVI
jgi:uncharacterized protein (TIGR03083 family)